MRPSALLAVIVLQAAGLALDAGAQAPATTPASPRALLGQAIDLYVVGRYREAADRLRPLVEGRVLKDQADQKEALRTFGISLYLSGSRPGAERAFRALLRLDAEARLDPTFVRPDVVAYFDTIRKRYRWELQEVVRQRGPKGYAVVNLIPPWGQFQNGHRTKGYWVLGGEVGLGAVSIATAAVLWSWREEDKTFGQHQSAAEILQPVNWAVFGAAVAVALYGVVDGLYYYYRRPPASKAPEMGYENPRHLVADSPGTIRF